MKITILASQLAILLVVTPLSAQEHEVPKESEKENADPRAEIQVNKDGILIKGIGTFMSPDGTKRLVVKLRDKDLVDFEVFDAVTGKKHASDSIGWSAMRWFLYWENSSKLWGYGSDIQYFKLFEFNPDGVVEETNVEETLNLPSTVWGNLPSSLQKKFKAEKVTAK